MGEISPALQKIRDQFGGIRRCPKCSHELTVALKKQNKS